MWNGGVSIVPWMHFDVFMCFEYMKMLEQAMLTYEE